MKIRRDAMALGDQFKQLIVHLDRIERRKTQHRQIGHEFQNARDERAEFGLARQIGAP